jgi:hypothetical protein
MDEDKKEILRMDIDEDRIDETWRRYREAIDKNKKAPKQTEGLSCHIR